MRSYSDVVSQFNAFTCVLVTSISIGTLLIKFCVVPNGSEQKKINIGYNELPCHANRTPRSRNAMYSLNLIYLARRRIKQHLSKVTFSTQLGSVETPCRGNISTFHNVLIRISDSSGLPVNDIGLARSGRIRRRSWLHDNRRRSVC